MECFTSDNVGMKKREGDIALGLVGRSSRVSRASLGGGVSLHTLPTKLDNIIHESGFHVTLEFFNQRPVDWTVRGLINAVLMKIRPDLRGVVLRY